MYENLAILAAFVFAYSLGARIVERTALSAAIVASAFGWLLGPHVLGLLRIDIDGPLLQHAAELTLALVLFSDASGADLNVLRTERALPLRLLLVGLPLTVALGTLVAHWIFPELPWVEAALLATMLAPTDAALGAPVVVNPQIPAAIREGLNVESGLNDGICVPLLFVMMGLSDGQSPEAIAPRLLLEELGIGGGVGFGVALLGGLAIHRSDAHQWMEGVWAWVILPSLAVLCFATAEGLGGSGFIAAFVGGVTYGAGARRKTTHALRETATGVGDTASLLTWAFFGAAVLGRVLPSLDVPSVAYALLSLTVIRMLPVWISLLGTGLDLRSKLFIGWFGPRGLASVVFIVIVLEGKLPGDELMGRSVVAAVAASVLLHGLSARPLSAWIGNETARRA